LVDSGDEGLLKLPKYQTRKKEFRMRTLGAAILATVLFASSSFAADAPLAPGKPAGVQKAQMEGTTTMWALGLAFVAGGIALAASGNGNTSVTTTTSGTGP
jgi:hypothetical protein